MDDKDIQFLNAQSPIFFKLHGKLIYSKLEHPKKAYSPKILTVSGIEIKEAKEKAVNKQSRINLHRKLKISEIMVLEED